MKKVSRLNVFGIIFVFLFTAFLADSTSSYAERKRGNVTKSGIKERARTATEEGLTRWKSLSPEQQEYLKEEAKVRGKEAKVTGEEYWNSLSAEEQQQFIEHSKEGFKKGRKWWQNLPE